MRTKLTLCVLPLFVVACAAEQEEQSPADTGNASVPASDATRKTLGVDRWSVNNDASGGTIDGYDDASQVVYRFEAHTMNKADGTHDVMRFGNAAHFVDVEVLKSIDTGNILGGSWSTSGSEPLADDTVRNNLQNVLNDIKNASGGTGSLTHLAAVRFGTGLHPEDGTSLVDTACENVLVRLTAEAFSAVICSPRGIYNGSDAWGKCIDKGSCD